MRITYPIVISRDGIVGLCFVAVLLLTVDTVFANASKEYDFGFAAGLRGNSNICDRLPISTTPEIERHNDCYNAHMIGLHIYDKGTAPYEAAVAAAAGAGKTLPSIFSFFDESDF